IDAQAGDTLYGPSLLPDGKTILYSVTRGAGANRWDVAEIIAQQPGGTPKVVVRGGSDARYLPTGHLVYAAGTVLFGVAFDPNTLQTTGGPVPIVNGVQRAGGATTGSANYGVSDRGTLVYLNSTSTTISSDATLGLVDR